MKITIEDRLNNLTVSVEGEAINLEETLTLIASALRGAGFIIDGNLVISEELYV